MFHPLYSILALILFIISIKKVASFNMDAQRNLFNAVKENARLLLWGLILLTLLMFIPYQIWVLTGSSAGWDGMYIIGGTGLLMVIFSFAYFYRESSRAG
ncbi:hypothetical protein [Bacillus sp. KH172YL63]|uniref:hypothetical protein n=1 Tax=Bacillus sp. KH172YL63 TaxID=2709784 RepID=UPI0013E4D2F9|nr:hypothetical protein [Bacillus sp. KH172YL63]BCB03993.1 hypothetical protein KH172YL63_21260 [Bacillus sp. KH172YL63]